MRKLCLPVMTLCACIAVACGSGSRDVPVSPVAPGDSNAGNISAPTPVSPSDDQQLDTTRPTLTVSNSTSSGQGSRVYEFQVADNNGFTVVAGRFAVYLVAYTQAGVPEGTGGQTSLAIPTDLLPSTRYYWRARAIQGTGTGPWSNTARFKTKIDSFKSGNQVFDILTNGRTVADLSRGVSFFGTGDALPGAKLESATSYLGYKVGTLQEGEASFVMRRVKLGDNSFAGQTKLLTMLNGTTGPLESNPYRVMIDKFREAEGSNVRLEMRSNNNGNATASGGQDWSENKVYYLKFEWRGGNARVRIMEGDNESAPVKIDISTTYTAPYNPTDQVITIGGLFGDTMRDMRVSRLYIGPYARPVALGNALAQ